jgi:DNA processing protein
MTYKNPVKRENLFHTALILSKKLKIANKTSNQTLRDKLLELGSFEEIFKSEFELSNPSLSDIEDIPGMKYVITTLKKLDFDYGLLTITDESYPQSLSSRKNTTPAFYFRGDLSLLNNPSIAVVGTRELEEKTHLDEAANAMDILASKKLTIVSGLAKGSDTYGHENAIKLNLPTIAILGTPIDKSYPAENRRLQETIANNHLLISEYPIGIRTYPNHFAFRNLTTVSLSTDGILVIRTKDKVVWICSNSYGIF